MRGRCSSTTRGRRERARLRNFIGGFLKSCVWEFEIDWYFRGKHTYTCSSRSLWVEAAACFTACFPLAYRERERGGGLLCLLVFRWENFRIPEHAGAQASVVGFILLVHFWEIYIASLLLRRFGRGVQGLQNLQRWVFGELLKLCGCGWKINLSKLNY